MEGWCATSEFAAGRQYPTPCRDFASESRSAAGMRTGFRAVGRHGAGPMEGWRATRYFTKGEYLHALRLTSELVDLRAADANRIPCREGGAEPVRWRGIAYPKEKHPKMGCFSFGCYGLKRYYFKTAGANLKMIYK